MTTPNCSRTKATEPSRQASRSGRLVRPVCFSVPVNLRRCPAATFLPAAFSSVGQQPQRESRRFHRHQESVGDGCQRTHPTDVERRPPRSRKRRENRKKVVRTSPEILFAPPSPGKILRSFAKSAFRDGQTGGLSQTENLPAIAIAKRSSRTCRGRRGSVAAFCFFAVAREKATFFFHARKYRDAPAAPDERRRSFCAGGTPASGRNYFCKVVDIVKTRD